MSVRIEIGIDSVMPEVLAPFWADALGYGIGDMDRAETYLDLVPPEPGLPVVYLQRVSEPKTVKNRLHLDLLTADVEATLSRLIALGATRGRNPDVWERRGLVAGDGGPGGQRVLHLSRRLDRRL